MVACENYHVHVEIETLVRQAVAVRKKMVKLSAFWLEMASPSFMEGALAKLRVQYVD